MVRTIYWQDTILFIYDIWKSADVNSNFPNPKHEVNDFKSGKTVVLEFQILLHNFKASKKVDIVKAYLFRLLEIYFIDDSTQSTMLILDKRQRKDDK